MQLCQAHLSRTSLVPSPRYIQRVPVGGFLQPILELQLRQILTHTCTEVNVQRPMIISRNSQSEKPVDQLDRIEDGPKSWACSQISD